MKIVLTVLFVMNVCISIFGQENIDLKKFLSQTYSLDSARLPHENGRWVYNSLNNPIQKIISPLINRLYPDIEFYKTKLTHIWDWHINLTECLILYYPTESDILLVEPLWFGGISYDFLKLFIGQTFENRETLISIITELQNLMLVGSSMSFRDFNDNDDKITFNLFNSMNGRIKLWRNIEVTTQDNIIVSFKSVNPITKDIEEVK